MTIDIYINNTFVVSNQRISKINSCKMTEHLERFIIKKNIYKNTLIIYVAKIHAASVVTW